MKLPELKELMKQHKIRGSSVLNKPEILELLVEKGVLGPDALPKKEPPPPPRGDPVMIDGVCIRNQPRRVEMLDIDSGEVVVYPSMYKACSAHGTCQGVIAKYNGKIWRKKYEIKVFDKRAVDSS